MERLKVVILDIKNTSFSWNNGLFGILKEEDGVLHLWKIKEGKLSYYDDGVTKNICCTGVNNVDVIPTDMEILVKK